MTDKFKDDILKITNVLEHKIVNESVFWKGGFIDEIFIGTGYRNIGDKNGFI